MLPKYIIFKNARDNVPFFLLHSCEKDQVKLRSILKINLDNETTFVGEIRLRINEEIILQDRCSNNARVRESSPMSVIYPRDNSRDRLKRKKRREKVGHRNGGLLEQ